jgi:sortase (surface protein transpeptidase)
MSRVRESSSKKSKLGYVMIIAGIVIGLTAVLSLINNQKIPEVPTSDLVSKSAPSSVKPSHQAVSNYSVPPTDPKYIAIPAIGVANTPIVKLGLLNSGAIATPDNIYKTGWYDGSSLPGQPGAMFIYGHVSSWTANGIFYNLKKLVPGNKVIITRGDNTTYTYSVVSTKVYPYNNVNMTQVLSAVNAQQPGLNLMTCTGQVIAGTSAFNERLVVFTSLVAS